MNVAVNYRKHADEAEALAGQIREMGAKATAIKADASSFADAEKMTKTVMEEFKLISEIGGGESARLVDEEKVIRQMVVLVFGTRYERCLDEFLKNL